MMSFAHGTRSQTDKHEFCKLWTTHEERLKQCCYKWLNGRHDLIEDAISYSFEKAYSYHLDEQQEIKDPRAWLFRLTQNICIDLHRHQAKQRELIKQVESMPNTYFFSENGSEDLEEQILRECELNQICHRIAALPTDMQLAIEYRCVDELNYKEMAEKLHINQANARKRVQLARKMLLSAH